MKRLLFCVLIASAFSLPINSDKAAAEKFSVPPAALKKKDSYKNTQETCNQRFNSCLNTRPTSVSNDTKARNAWSDRCQQQYSSCIAQ